jgi:hypothetical protein
MIFLFTSFFLILGLIIQFNSVFKNNFRESILKTFLAYSFFVLISNEILSVFNLLNSDVILLVYLLSIASIWVHIYYCGFLINGIKNIIKSVLQLKYFFNIFQLIFIVLILSTLLFLSIFIAPNNVDAMGYHIPRVILWAQNHNLKHFPTEFLAQLFYNVQLEYFYLHAYLLTGSDLYFNCFQWFTLLIVLITTSKLIKLWDFDANIQGLGVIVTLTIPLTILTSTSSKNDLLSACYLLIAIYYGFKCIGMRFTWLDIFYCLSAFVFAGFTKYSVWLLAFPLALCLGFYFLKDNLLKSLKILGIFSGVFLIIFGSFFYRNYSLFGAFVRPVVNSKIAVPSYSNEVLSWKTIVSNLTKMAGNHVGLPWDFWNKSFDNLVFKVHELINFPPNNYLTSWSSYITNFTINEDFSGNFLHFFLILISVILCLGNKKMRSSIQFQYFISLFGGLLIYALMIKWNAFNARTQFPYFIALSPFITFTFAKYDLKLLKIVCIFLLFQALPFIFLNANKKILPFYYWYKKEVSHLPKSIFYDQSMKPYYEKLDKNHIYFTETDIKGQKILMVNPNLSNY